MSRSVPKYMCLVLLTDAHRVISELGRNSVSTLSTVTSNAMSHIKENQLILLCVPMWSDPYKFLIAHLLYHKLYSF